MDDPTRPIDITNDLRERLQRRARLSPEDPERTELDRALRAISGTVVARGWPLGSRDPDLLLETVVDVGSVLGAFDVTTVARLQLADRAIRRHRHDETDGYLGSITSSGVTPAMLPELGVLQADHLSVNGRLDEALKTLDGVDHDRLALEWRLRALTIRANVLEELGAPAADVDQAFVTVWMAADAAYRAAPDNADLGARAAYAACRLATRNIASGRRRKGLELAGRSRELIERLDLWPEDYLDFARRLGDAWRDEGSLSEAVGWYLRAVASMNDAADRITDPFDRSAFLDAWQQVQDRLVAALVATGRMDEAAAHIDAGKSRVLSFIARLHRPADALTSDAVDRDSLAQEEARAWRSLRAGRTDDSIEATREQLRLIRARRMAQTLPERTTVRSADELVAAASAGASGPIGIAEIHCGEASTTVVLAGAGDTVAVDLGDWPRSRWWDEVRTPWDETMQASAPFDQPRWDAAIASFALRLSETAWQPIREEVRQRGIRRLVMVPHGPLHSAPFAAMHGPTPDDLAIDELDELIVAPSIGFLEASRPESAVPGAGGVVFSVADSNAPLIEIEGLWVARSLRANGFGTVVRRDGHEATAGALARASRGAEVVHVASHGQWFTGSVATSGLLLSKPEGDDGLVFGDREGLLNVVAILGELDLRSCRMFVASACESGLSRHQRSDEPVSLPTALCIAGAEGVIASLWLVRDDSTLLLMDALYRGLRRGTAPAAALLAAQRAMRAVTAHEAAVVLGKLEPLATPGSRAERLIADHRRALAAMPPDAHPYRDPDHWAAFTYVGRS